MEGQPASRVGLAATPSPTSPPPPRTRGKHITCNGSGVNWKWVYDCPLNVCFGARVKNVSTMREVSTEKICGRAISGTVAMSGRSSRPPTGENIHFRARESRNYVGKYFQPSVLCNSRECKTVVLIYFSVKCKEYSSRQSKFENFRCSCVFE